jgi:hypothetical protein
VFHYHPLNRSPLFGLSELCDNYAQAETNEEILSDGARSLYVDKRSVILYSAGQTGPE